MALAARNQAKLASLVKTLQQQGVVANAYPVDAADPASVRSLITDVEAAVGGLSTVHYNAAVSHQGPLSQMSDDEVTSGLLVNIGGALATVRAAEKIFAGRGGTIFLTGGGLALFPNPNFVTLGLSKAGIRWVAQALFAPMKERNIHLASVTVNRVITPGSSDAASVADAFWALQSELLDQWSWEHSYPG